MINVFPKGKNKIIFKTLKLYIQNKSCKKYKSNYNNRLCASHIRFFFHNYFFFYFNFIHFDNHSKRQIKKNREFK